jgi:hypothetical protein
VAAVVVLALLVGGLTQVSRQSQDYDASSARTLAEQGSVVADQSNATSSAVRTFMRGLQGQTRQGLQVALDSAVQQTASESARADLASQSSPLGQVSTEFATVFAERAQSMADMRAAFDGFLGMAPLPPAGVPVDTGASATPATLLSATQATDRIAAAGALLSHADALYRSVRGSLAAGVGHGRLPRSVWVTHPGQWQAGSVAGQVDLLATSPTLAATHDVVLRTVRLSPPALPTAQSGSSSVAVLSPVSHVGVTTVLANQGSVEEPRVHVRLTLADQTTGATATRDETTALRLGSSVTLPLATFGVAPGKTYALTVAVILPAGQTLTPGTALQQVLQVAPAS